MFYYDSTMILIIIGAGIAFLAQSLMQRAYKKYAQVRARSGVTGAQVAQALLKESGIDDVQIVRIAGNLTDNFNPDTRVLSLSQGVHDGNSIAALGVAAHECGHAMQYHLHYAPLNLRKTIVPSAQIGSQLSWSIFLGGLMFSFRPLILIGIALYIIAVFFTLVTLPVEFDASHRALLKLESTGYLAEDELFGAKKVLKAAAMTYVAAALSAILQLLRLIMLSNNSRRRD